MKRTIVILLVLVMLLPLAACGGKTMATPKRPPQPKRPLRQRPNPLRNQRLIQLRNLSLRAKLSRFLSGIRSKTRISL